MDTVPSLFAEPWPWWLGGIVIGLLVPVMYFFLNLSLGVSTGFGNVVKMVVPHTKLRWLNSETFADVFSWRLFFIVGIVIGAFLAARVAGGPLATLEMGVFTSTVDWPFVALAVWFFAGGLLLGLGARVAGGCTSGHGIHGLANLHASSFVAIAGFMLSAAATTYFVSLLVLGGA